MANPIIQPKIASSQMILHLLQSDAGLEATAGTSAAVFSVLHEAACEVISDGQTRSELVAEFIQALRELQSEAVDVDADLLASPPHRMASILQSVFAEHADRLATDDRLEIPFNKRDVKPLVREALDRAAHIPRHHQMRPDSAKPEPLADDARIFVVGDFGTGMYGAPISAATIQADHRRFDLLLHLGDVYYSGETEEVQQRLLGIWPRRHDAISRNLNGNHDMYSGGYGYFDFALPKFDQTSSYFAMQNKRWTLLFLDTAYKDNNLNRKQVRWIGKVVENSGDRRVILFSHHHLFSNFKDPGVRLASKLHELLESGRVAAWYWGHEHHCAVYDPHPMYKMRARCLGHGGMPSKRKHFAELKVEREVLDFNWRRMVSELTPPCLYLDGPNEDIPGKSDKYLPHGYAVIELSGSVLKEEICSPRGEVLYSGEIL